MAPKAAPKAAPTHAPYVDMIKSAIVSLKDRTGSSLPALQKKIGKLQTYPWLLHPFHFCCPSWQYTKVLVMLTSIPAALSQLLRGSATLNKASF